jgi:hypothetical protein
LFEKDDVEIRIPVPFYKVMVGDGREGIGKSTFCYSVVNPVVDTIQFNIDLSSK